MSEKGRFLGCLLGLACGDAVGTTVEFKPRGSFPPVTDMVGGGPFGLDPGQWTDDTSMALCLAESLVECNGFNPYDQMDRYVRWWREGYLSSTGRCFDIGNAVSGAIRQFQESGEPFSGSEDPWKAGNGCIMRLAPVPMFYHPDLEATVHFSGESARTTHGAQHCLDASRLFGAVLHMALSGCPKEEILCGGQFSDGWSPPLSPKVHAIADGAYRDKTEDEIRGTGYVVDSLEAGLWCFHHTDTFREAILRAVNLGDDADTTGAVCGQVAGAFYGVEEIPDQWLEILTMREKIEELVRGLQ